MRVNEETQMNVGICSEFVSRGQATGWIVGIGAGADKEVGGGWM